MRELLKGVNTPKDDYRLGNVDLNDVPNLEDCNVGIEECTEWNVIIAPAKMSEKKTAGGIILTDDTYDKQNDAMRVGRIIMVSPAAFSYLDWGKFNAIPPQVGDIVTFAKYAGDLLEGNDDREYRMCKDRDVGNVVKRESRTGGKRAVIKEAA